MIEICSNKTDEYTEKLQAAAAAAAAVFKQKDRLAVSFSFVSAKRMREINLKFRKKDKPTDVLSFPALDLKGAARGVPVIRAKDWPLDRSEDGAVFIGDIIICKSIAKKQGREYGHGEEREIEYLFIHGLLHLFGFDHKDDGDKKVMREYEEKILGKVRK